VTEVINMFYMASKFNQSFKNWDFSSITSASKMINFLSDSGINMNNYLTFLENLNTNSYVFTGNINLLNIYRPVAGNSIIDKLSENKNINITDKGNVTLTLKVDDSYKNLGEQDPEFTITA